MPIALMTVVRLCIMSIVIGLYCTLLHLFAKNSIPYFVTLRYPSELKLGSKTEITWRRHLTHGFTLLGAPLIIGILLLLNATLNNASVEAKVLLMFTPIGVITISAVSGFLVYREFQRQLQSADHDQIFGARYRPLLNNLMLAAALERVANFLWYATATIAILVVFEMPSMRPLREVRPDYTPPGFWQIILGFVLFICIVVTTMRVRNNAKSHIRLAETFLKLFVKREAAALASASPPIKFHPGRWRSPEHEIGVELAARLERCVVDAQRRLDAADAKFVVNTYFRLASALRQAAIRSSDSEHNTCKFDKIVAMTVVFVLDDNPVMVAKAARHLVADVPEPTPPAPSRARILLANVSDSLPKHEKTVRILGFLIVIMALIISGQLNRVIGIFAK